MRTVQQHHSHRTRRALVPLVAALALGGGVGLAACGNDDGPNGTDDTSVVDDVETFDESLIVGLPYDEATEVAEAEGFELRIAREDGEDLALTMDFIPNRVNVEVEDGIVTQVLNQG